MLSVILPIFYEQWQDQILLTDTYSLGIRIVHQILSSSFGHPSYYENVSFCTLFEYLKYRLF